MHAINYVTVLLFLTFTTTLRVLPGIEYRITALTECRDTRFKRGAVPHSVNIPFHTAFGPEGDLVPCAAVQILNQHRSQVKVVVGSNRGRHASHVSIAIDHDNQIVLLLVLHI